MAWNSSLREKPLCHGPRRLADWLNPTGAKKVHSLVDKVYQKKNLELAWEKVKANRGAGGIDGQSLKMFETALERNLERLHQELKTQTYQPQPVRHKAIPKPGQPGKFRSLGIPTLTSYCTSYNPVLERQMDFTTILDELQTHSDNSFSLEASSLIQ